MTTPTTENTPKPTPEPIPTDDAPLGDAGKAALDKERKARGEAERQLRDTRAQLTERETADLRRDVALEHGLSDAQARFLGGATREELAASADELLAAFAPERPAGPARRPVEALRGGGLPDTENDASATALADEILNRRGI